MGRRSNQRLPGAAAGRDRRRRKVALGILGQPTFAATPRPTQQTRATGRRRAVEPRRAALAAATHADGHLPRERCAAARAPRRTDPRGCRVGGRRRRVQCCLRRAQGPGRAGPGSPRLLRQWARRGAIQPAGRRRSSTRCARRTRCAAPGTGPGRARARRHRSGPALWWHTRVAGQHRSSGSVGRSARGAVSRSGDCLVRSP